MQRIMQENMLLKTCETGVKLYDEELKKQAMQSETTQEYGPESMIFQNFRNNLSGKLLQ